MRQLFSLAVIFSVVLFACESEEKENEEVASSDKIATFEVTGMVCKMGCGGEIRKHLYNTSKVDQVDVEFDEDAPSNKIDVHFASEKISKEEIIEIISEINEGQFSAEFIDEKEKSKKTSRSSTESYKTGKKEQSIVKAEETNFKLPNITKLFNSLIY